MFWFLLITAIGGLLFLRWEIKMAWRSGYMRRKR